MNKLEQPELRQAHRLRMARMKAVVDEKIALAKRLHTPLEIGDRPRELVDDAGSRECVLGPARLDDPPHRGHDGRHSGSMVELVETATLVVASLMR